MARKKRWWWASPATWINKRTFLWIFFWCIFFQCLLLRDSFSCRNKRCAVHLTVRFYLLTCNYLTFSRGESVAVQLGEIIAHVGRRFLWQQNMQIWISLWCPIKSVAIVLMSFFIYHESAYCPSLKDVVSLLDQYWPNLACREYEELNLSKKHLAATLIDKLHQFSVFHPLLVITLLHVWVPVWSLEPLLHCREVVSDHQKYEFNLLRMLLRFALFVCVCLVRTDTWKNIKECPWLIAVCCMRSLMPPWHPCLCSRRISRNHKTYNYHTSLY